MLRPFVSYLVWHFTKSISDFFEVAGNLLWFLWHFFSISELSKTLFAPWQRLGESHHRGEGLEGFFEIFVLNTIMRVVGFLLRGFVIVFGLVVLAITLSIIIALFIVWILLPFIIVLLFISGIRLMLK